jgi:hypothetical protein
MSARVEAELQRVVKQIRKGAEQGSLVTGLSPLIPTLQQEFSRAKEIHELEQEKLSIVLKNELRRVCFYGVLLALLTSLIFPLAYCTAGAFALVFFRGACVMQWGTVDDETVSRLERLQRLLVLARTLEAQLALALVENTGKEWTEAVEICRAIRLLK